MLDRGPLSPNRSSIYGQTSSGAVDAPIVLLCPPSRQTVQRDCYCSHIAKADYCWHPFDLVVQSGYLARLGSVELVDAVAEKLNVEQTLNRLRGRPLRAVLSLVGSACQQEDMAFLRQLSDCCNSPIFVSGDFACSHPLQTLREYPFIEGVLLSFISDDLQRYLNFEPAPYANLCLRDHPRVRKNQTNSSCKNFDLVIPRWELFSKKNYRLPFLRHLPFAAVTTSFGCPYTCSFCTAADLGFKLRGIDNVMNELRFLKKAGYRELHFKDFSFGCHIPHYTDLLTRMHGENLGFGFFCLARADHLQLELTKLMRMAGCHLVHLGVESASADTLKRHHKQVAPDQIGAAVDNCKKSGLRTLASFILGLPGESREDMLRTIEYAVELDTDFVSFNIYSQRNGWSPDQEKTTVETAKDLSDLLDLAYRRFYFRPGYLARQIRSLVSVTHFRLSAASAIYLAKKHLLKYRTVERRIGKAGNQTQTAETNGCLNQYRKLS